MTRLLRTLAVAALGLSLLSVSPEASAGALPAAPVVGDCHLLTFNETYAESDSSPTVDCAATHTTRTVAVVTMPEDIDWSSGDVVTRLAVPCYRALDATLGRTARDRARSAYGLVFFIPTPEERTGGAHWVRCDAVLYKARTLSPIPDTTPLLEKPLTDQVRRCLTGKPYFLTVCAGRHAFRVTGLVLMTFDSYPSQRRAQRLADAKCPSRVSSSYWRYTYPSKLAWRAGQRFLQCYTKTSR